MFFLKNANLNLKSYFTFIVKRLLFVLFTLIIIILFIEIGFYFGIQFQQAAPIINKPKEQPISIEMTPTPNIVSLNATCPKRICTPLAKLTQGDILTSATNSAIHPDALSSGSLKAITNAPPWIRKEVNLSIKDKGRILAIDWGKNTVEFQGLDMKRPQSVKSPFLPPELDELIRFYAIISPTEIKIPIQKEDIKVGDVIEINSNYDMISGGFTAFEIDVIRE